MGVVAELVDVSRGGALVVTPCTPPPGEAVRLSAAEGLRPSALGRVVGSARGDLGHRLHLEFVGACPAAFLRAALGDGAGPGRGVGL